MALLFRQVSTSCFRAANRSHSIQEALWPRIKLTPHNAATVSRSVLPVFAHAADINIRQLRRDFHTSPHRPAPPIVWLVVRAIAQVGSILGGRSVTSKEYNMSK
jgi:hypothetical protein